MHDSMMAHAEMDQEHHQSSQEHAYGSNEGWVDMNQNHNHNYVSSQHQSPVYEHGGFNFMHQPGHHGMTMEPPSFTSPRLHPLSPPTTSHHQLVPLIMPSNPTWPSMLLSNQANYSSPPIAISAIPAPLVRGTGNKSPAMHTPTPRKTLTDNDRRKMCQYHEDNPTVKQTEIGAMFGVERSTVSKVLRQKDKYLYPEDKSLSPVKRAKGKAPDIERTLSIWVRRQQRLGLPLSDEIIKEKATFFATSVSDGSSHVKPISTTWLERFKQKNGVGIGKLTRRASTTNIADRNSVIPESRHSSSLKTPKGMSPTSPDILPSPSPLSGTKSEEDIKPDGVNGYFNFSQNGIRYKHSNSQSTTSLSSIFTDAPFSAGPTSPTTPFAFSPDQTSAPWLPSQYVRQPPSSSSFQRPRSQTFPSVISTLPHETITPNYNLPVTAPPSALDSPVHEMAPPFTMHSTIGSSPLHHSNSNGSMGPPSSNNGITGLQSPPGSSAPSSPTQDDARRALDTLLTYFQHDQSKYLTLLSMTENLRIQQNPGLNALPGGLHRIAEQDCEAVPKPEKDMNSNC